MYLEEILAFVALSSCDRSSRYGEEHSDHIVANSNVCAHPIGSFVEFVLLHAGFQVSDFNSGRCFHKQKFLPRQDFDLTRTDQHTSTRCKARRTVISMGEERECRLTFPIDDPSKVGSVCKCRVRRAAQQTCMEYSRWHRFQSYTRTLYALSVLYEIAHTQQGCQDACTTKTVTTTRTANPQTSKC